MHKGLLVSHPMGKKLGEKKKKTCFQPKSRKSKRTNGTKKPKATRRFKANDIKNYTKSKHLKHSVYKGDYKIRCKIQLHTAYKKFLVAEVSQRVKCLLRTYKYLSLNPSTHIKVVCSQKHLNCPALVRRQAEPQGSLVRQSNRKINRQVQWDSPWYVILVVNLTTSGIN